MRKNFDAALKAVLISEGGYVNDPRDPGGATCKGVTQAVYDAFRKRAGSPTRSVRLIGPEELAAIYRFQYWDLIKGDALPSGVDYAVFDFAVNSGVVRAAKYLQRALGVTADGAIGNITVHAAESSDRAGIINAICNARIAFLKKARHPKTGALLWPTYGGGWQKRVDKVRAAALAMK